MATFEQWILAAVPNYPIKTISYPFERCPLAGKEKYNRYLFGCEYKLGSVGTTKKKWHREHRYNTLTKAFFAACRNYWCVRRTIVRWRERRMQEQGSGRTLAGDLLSELPPQMLVRLVDGRTKHTFYIRDLLRHMRTRLFNSDYFIPEPLAPTNPLTGMTLSESNQMRIYMTIFGSDVYMALHQVLITYWRVGFNMNLLRQWEQVLLHEMAIVNEPGQAGVEILQDLADMYYEARMDVVLVPSVAEANAIGTIDVLIQTHMQAFQSYYLMTRSWCDYMSQTAKNNLPAHCAAALAVYSAKTLDQRRQYWMARSPSLSPPLSIEAQPAALPVARQLEFEMYEDDEDDEESLVMTLPDDLELVQARPPTPLIFPDELLDQRVEIMNQIAREEGQVGAAAAAVADLIPDGNEEADVGCDNVSEDEWQEVVERDIEVIERQTHLTHQWVSEDELVELVSKFAEEYLRPLSLEVQSAEAEAEARDPRPWAAAAMARAQAERQQQEEV
jgi:hypothetical protein